MINLEISLIFKKKKFTKSQVVSKLNKLDKVDRYVNMGVRGELCAIPKTVGLSKRISMNDARDRLLSLLVLHGDPDI